MSKSEENGSISITDLPEEILIEIFRYLATSTLICGVSQTCTSWNWIVQRESDLGRLVKDIALDRNRLRFENLDLGDSVSQILTRFSPLQGLELNNFTKKDAEVTLQQVMLHTYIII